MPAVGFALIIPLRLYNGPCSNKFIHSCSRLFSCTEQLEHVSQQQFALFGQLLKFSLLVRLQVSWLLAVETTGVVVMVMLLAAVPLLPYANPSKIDAIPLQF